MAQPRGVHPGDLRAAHPAYGAAAPGGHAAAAVRVRARAALLCVTWRGGLPGSEVAHSAGLRP